MKKGMRLARPHVLVCLCFFGWIVISLVGEIDSVTMAGSEVSAPVFVPSILATKTAALQSDGNGNGFVNPGDGLRYTVTVNNSGTDATGVNFNDMIDANTTFIPGSLVVSPIAVNDAYSSIGNVGINVPAASGVLTNDLNPNAAVAPSILSVNQAGLQGTLVLNNADGSFTFTPNVGFEGSTTFVYTLGNGTGLTDTATVTINVTGMIWFINNSAAACTTIAAGCGRLSSPFSTLAAFNTANVGGGSNPDNNDNIFVYESGSGYAGAVTLRSGQKLIGQDATATLASIAGVTVPAFSSPALPAMNSANGTITNISSTVTLNTNAVLRGLSINSTTSAGINDPASAITGVSVSEASVATTTGTAVALSDLGGAISLRSVSANGAANGIALTNTTGSFTVTGDGGGANNGSGGTITGCVGANMSVGGFELPGNGVYLRNVQSVSLRYLNVSNNQNSGIFGDDVTGLTVERSNISNNGNTTGLLEAGMRFYELIGTASFTNSSISGSHESNILLTPASGTLVLTVSASTIGPNSSTTGLDGLQINGSGTAQVTVTVDSTLFSGNRSQGVSSSFLGSSKQNWNIQNSTFQNHTNAISLITSDDADLTYDIHDNPTIVNSSANAINLVTGNANNGAKINGKIRNNSIGNATIDSGSVTSYGIAIDMQSDQDAVIEVSNNIIQHTDIEGIFVQSRLDNDGDGEVGLLDLTLRDNSVTSIDDNSAFPFFTVYGIRVESRNTSNLCLDVASNNAVSVGGFEHFRVRQRDTSTFRAERLALGSQSAATMAAFMVAQNDAGSTASATVATSFTGVANGTCRKPVVPFAFAVRTPEGEDDSTQTTQTISQTDGRSAEPLSAVFGDLSLWKSVQEGLSQLVSSIVPTVRAGSETSVAPFSGETVTKSIGLIPAGEQVVIRFDVTVDAAMPTNVYSVSNQGTVSGVGFSNVLTDDPAVAGAANPTVTSVIQAPTFTKAFSPTTVATNTGVSTLTFTLVNGNPSQALSNVAFTDALQNGVQVATTPAATTSGCGVPTWAPAAAATNLTFSGGSINAGATCTVSVNVRSTTEGTKNNVSSTATSTQANPSSTATANLTVINAPTFTKAFGASSVPLNGSTSLTFTITNTSATSSLTGVGFTDTLPAGLVVATPPGTTGSCGGGTITANAGAGSITLAGATLAPSGTCTFTVNVTGTTVGVKNNTATLSTTELGIGAIASAGLTVVAPPTISNSFALGTIVTGQSTMVNIVVTNPGSNPLALTGVSFTNMLPPGVVTTTATSAQCGGTLTVTAPGNISLSSATISSGGSCAIGVPVTGAQAGNWSNTISSVSSTNGGTNNTASTANITVNKATTSASITNGAALTTPTVVGEAYSVAAALNVGSPGASSPTAPSGTITISDGSQTCLISLPGGTTCLLTSTSTGTPKNLTATYSGDANFLASPASPNVPHTVNKAGTTIQISSDDPDPSIVGQSVSVLFNLMVTSPGAGSPSGNVTVSDGVDSCIGTVAAGQCSIALTTAGSRMLSASYSGDTSFNASISPGESHQVNLPCTTNPVVSASGDSGPGTLRQAVLDACDGNTITFAGSVAGPVTVTSGQIAINRNLIILGPSGGLTVSGNNSTRLFEVANGANLTIGRLTLSGGSSTSGAAFYVNPNCTLNLSDSTISGNSASVEGGGVYNDDGVVNLTSSTVSSNAGGLSGGGVSNNRGVVTLINSTISGNSATGGIGGSGGGVFNTGTLNLTHTTITNNSVGAVGSGLFNGNGIVNIRNSVVAANSGSSSSADVAGAFVSTGYNLIGNVGIATGFSAVGDQVGSSGSPLNPLLAPLAMNGGLSPTHSISSPLSPLIDKGHSFGLAVDQRGLLRPLDLSFPNAPGGDGADIGAFETLMPTAAAVTLSGRVLTPEGRGVRNATVWLTDSQNVTRRVRTGAFGQYLFVNINAGESYVIGVSSRRFGFDPRVIHINEDLFGIDFVGIELVGLKQ